MAEIALRERIRSVCSDTCVGEIIDIIAEAKRLPYPPCAMALEALALRLMEFCCD